MADYVEEGNSESRADFLQDLLIAHQIGILRVANGTTRTIVKRMNENEDEFIAGIISALEKIGIVTAANYVSQQPKVERVITELSNERMQSWQESKSLINKEMVALALWEATWQQNAVRRVLKDSPATLAPFRTFFFPESLATILLKRTPIRGKTLSDWFDLLAANDTSRVAEAVRIGLREGVSPQEVGINIRGTATKSFDDGISGRVRNQVDSLVKTAAVEVTQSVREKVWTKNKKRISGVVWTSVLDGRTSEICRGLDGRVAPLFGKEDTLDPGLPRLEPPDKRPPAHFRCLPGDSLVASRSDIAGVSKRWFEGNLVVLRTAGQQEISCTPNHPILTGRGWVAAELVNETDCVFSDSRTDLPFSSGESEDQYVVSTLEELFDSFVEDGPIMSIMTVADDFHGDGVDDEVCVVAVNRNLLPTESQSFLRTHVKKDFLKIRSETSRSLSAFSMCQSSSVGLGNPSDSVMCSLDLSMPFLRSSSFPDSFISGRRLLPLTWPVPSGSGPRFLGSVTASLLKESYDRRGAAAQFTGNVEERFSGQVSLNDAFRIRELEEGCSSNPSQIEKLEHRSFAAADTPAYILSRFSGQVSSDNVVFVGKKKFSGHVFNLETVDGWYSAGEGNLIVHNCRSLMSAIVDGKLPRETSYETWLTKQPKDVQQDILGPRRFSLLEQGTLDFKQLFDGPTGRPLTLAELKVREGFE